MSAKILITPRSLTRDGHPALSKLTDAGFELVYCTAGQMPDAAELTALLPGVVGWLAGVEPITAEVLAAATDLRVISRNGTGANNIDAEAAQTAGITVQRAAGANARGVAELTMAMMFALVRSLPYSDARLKECAWERRTGIELAGRTLGLIGCGAIGQELARMALGIGMRVLATDPYPPQGFDPGDGFELVDFDTVIRQADVLSLHCPPSADGIPLITAATLAAIKPGSYLINTARGDLLDDAAVLAALDAGTLAGVALDAFRSEPPGDDPLVTHDRVIATPHIGALTEESVSRAVAVAVDNLLAVLDSVPA